MDHSSVWELRGVFGDERWKLTDSRCVCVDLGERHLEQNDFDNDLDLLALRTGTCKCAPYWPNAFSYCPECGNPLNQPVIFSSGPAATPETSAESNLWIPPFGALDGLPDWNAVPSAGRVQGEQFHYDTKLQVKAMPLEGANLHFVVGGTPSRLYSIERQQGGIFRWVQTPGDVVTAGRWVKCANIDRAFNLPAWAWAAAVSASGFAVPTDGGPIWLRCSPTAPYSVVRPDAALGIRSCVSGCVRYERDLYVPVRTAAGLAMASYSETVDAWTVSPVAGGEQCAEEAFFAAPVVNGRDIFWVGTAGYICVTDRMATYLPWKDGFSAECGFRPLLDTSCDMLFQLGSSDELYYASLVPEAAMPEYRRVDGYTVSAGRSVFRGGERYNTPWMSSHSERFRLREGEFVLPLLNFGDDTVLFAACSNRLEMTSFFSTDTTGPSRRCALHVGIATYVSPALNAVASASSAWDLSVFVYCGAVFVYSRQDNKCWCWNAGLKFAP